MFAMARELNDDVKKGLSEAGLCPVRSHAAYPRPSLSRLWRRASAGDDPATVVANLDRSSYRHGIPPLCHGFYVIGMRTDA